MSPDREPDPPPPTDWRTDLFDGIPADHDIHIRCWTTRGDAPRAVKILAWKAPALARILDATDSASPTKRDPGDLLGGLDSDDLMHLLYAAHLVRRAAAWAEDQVLVELMSRHHTQRPTAQNIAAVVGVHRRTLTDRADRAASAAPGDLDNASDDYPQVTLSRYSTGWELIIDGTPVESWAATGPNQPLAQATATATRHLGYPLAGWEEVWPVAGQMRTYWGVAIPPTRTRR